ncbi:hypothetical protein VZG28_04825 [Synechococcus elongatus IITB4]|uniref:hypothetical protein n=1 Tax=Synechococcus elongatus TaxID=32046 RepID=UPI0030D07602
MQIPETDDIARQLHIILASAPSNRWLWVFRTATYRVYAYLAERPGQESLVVVEVFKDIHNPDKDRPLDFVVWSGDLDSNILVVAELIAEALPKLLNRK